MKNKITDLNVKQVKPKDSHFKEFKITYKYKGKPISDFRAFDKNINKSNDELLNIVTKEANENLKNGKLAKYALKFTGFTKKVAAAVCTVVVVGTGAGVATPIIIQANIIPNVTFTFDSLYSDEITLSNKKAEYKKDFKTNFSVDFDTSYVVLPNSLVSVKVGEKELDATDYTYTFVDENNASLLIPGEHIDADITVKMEPYNPLYEPLTFEYLGPTPNLDFGYFVNRFAETIYTPLNPINVEYSLNGQAWQPFCDNVDLKTAEAGTDISCATLNPGDIISFRGDNPNNFNYCISSEYAEIQFYSDRLVAENNKLFKVRGNIMSLIDSSNFSKLTSLPPDVRGCFSDLFAGIDTIVDLQRLCLPATTLTDYCYQRMFNGNGVYTNRTRSIKKLPATQLKRYCYKEMFKNYNNLISAPKIYATELADYSCAEMFSGSYIKVSDNSTQGSLFFTCPETTGLTNPVGGMFASTKGAITTDPVPNTSYYYY